MRKFPMYRDGTREEVTSADLARHLEKVMSDILSVRYDCKVTIRLEGGDENEAQTATDNPKPN